MTRKRGPHRDQPSSVTGLPLLPLVAGPFVGSFLGVVIRRLPTGREIVFARSACGRCGAKLGVADLLPPVSYLWLRGRRYCGAPIKSFHIIIEIATTGVALWAVPA